MMTLYYPGWRGAAECGALPAEERKHLRAQRVREGETVRIVNGEGGAWEGRLARFTADECVITEIRAVDAREPEGARVVLCGVIAQPRMELLVELATPLGMTHLVLVNCERSQPVSVRVERLQAIAIAALKQCGRARLPVMEVVDAKLGMVAAAKLWQKKFPNAGCVVCDGGGETNIDYTTSQDVLYVIGPEGGLTDKEVVGCVAAGYQRLSLGSRVLRTELAAAVVVGG